MIPQIRQEIEQVIYTKTGCEIVFHADTEIAPVRIEGNPMPGDTIIQITSLEDEIELKLSGGAKAFIWEPVLKKEELKKNEEKGITPVLEKAPPKRRRAKPEQIVRRKK